MKAVNKGIEWCHSKVSYDSRQWPSRFPLLRWNGWRSFTVGHSLEHVLEFGATGSGKTSACIKDMALGMMHAGYGVLFLSAKATDPAEYVQWAKLAGRERSVVRFGPRQPLGFNLLEYELAREGQFAERTLNVSKILAAVGEILAGKVKPPGGESAVWEEAAQQMLRHALNIEVLATGKAELDNVVRIIRTAPDTVGEAGEKTWRRDSFCCQRLEAAELRHPGNREVWLARQYFLEDWARFPKDTKHSATFTFYRVAGLFQSDPLHRLFFSKTDFTPEILLDGAVIIAEEPALGGDVGRVINGLMRLATERMVKQRKCIGNERPVAIFWDEFQTSITSEDCAFAAVARSPRCALVMATQNVKGVRAVMGPDGAGAFFGNCRTKVFFANDDPDTNSYMADVVGKWPVKKESKSTDPKGKVSKQKHPAQDEYAVPPRVALVLKSGGKDFRGKVTGIMTHTGYKLTNGQPWLAVKFNQARPVWNWLHPLTMTTGAIGWRRPGRDFPWFK